jgi:hypothetical protein
LHLIVYPSYRVVSCCHSIFTTYYDSFTSILILQTIHMEDPTKRKLGEDVIGLADKKRCIETLSFQRTPESFVSSVQKNDINVALKILQGGFEGDVNKILDYDYGEGEYSMLTFLMAVPHEDDEDVVPKYILLLLTFARWELNPNKLDDREECAIHTAIICSKNHDGVNEDASRLEGIYSSSTKYYT